MALHEYISYSIDKYGFPKERRKECVAELLGDFADPGAKSCSHRMDA